MLGLGIDWQELLGWRVSVPKMACHILMARSLELWVRRGPCRVWLSQLRPLYQDSLSSSCSFPLATIVRHSQVPTCSR